MAVWIVLGSVLALGAVFWLWRRNTEDQTALGRADAVTAKTAAFESVSIQPGLDACSAVWLLVGDRYLRNEAPKLPVAACDKARCECRFNEHEDRREPGERRDPADVPGENAEEGAEHRSSRGRRREDRATAANPDDPPRTEAS